MAQYFCHSEQHPSQTNWQNFSPICEHFQKKLKHKHFSHWFENYLLIFHPKMLTNWPKIVSICLRRMLFAVTEELCHLKNFRPRYRVFKELLQGGQKLIERVWSAPAWQWRRNFSKRFIVKGSLGSNLKNDTTLVGKNAWTDEKFIKNKMLHFLRNSLPFTPFYSILLRFFVNFSSVHAFFQTSVVSFFKLEPRLSFTRNSFEKLCRHCQAGADQTLSVNFCPPTSVLGVQKVMKRVWLAPAWQWRHNFWSCFL